MNRDDPNDHRELNTRVENYVMAEFVAVPPDFDIKSHLSMREHVGIFEVKDMDIEQASIISTSISCSSVFNTMNNALMNPNICFFVLQLFQDLGLVVKSIDNPVRRSMDAKAYKKFSLEWEQGSHNYFRGQTVLRISFLIVNVVHLLNEEVYKEAADAMEKVHQFQTEINSSKFNLD